MKRHHKFQTTIISALLPLMANAAAPTNFAGVTELLINIVRGAMKVGWALLVVGFAWGIIKFLTSFEDERAREQGKQLMFWSVVVTAILLMIWGILSVLATSFGFTFGIPLLTPPDVP